MSTPAPVDIDVLRDEIQKTYTNVSEHQEQDFIFPTGRLWAESLGYPQVELGRVPEVSAQSFAGVANHFTLGSMNEGETVLDLGCGAGTDLLIAAQMVGRGAARVSSQYSIHALAGRMKHLYEQLIEERQCAT